MCGLSQIFGRGQNMLAIIKRCLSADFNVTFLTAATDSDHKEDLTTLGVDVHSVALNCSSFNSQIAHIKPDVVIFDRYMTEEQFSWRVKEACPNALRVLNTERFAQPASGKARSGKTGQ